MENDVNFNLQQFLSEMRSEMHEGFARIDATSVRVREDLTKHEVENARFVAETEGRFTALHDLQDSLKWSVRVTLGALIVSGVSWLFTHW